MPGSLNIHFKMLVSIWWYQNLYMKKNGVLHQTSIKKNKKIACFGGFQLILQPYAPESLIRQVAWLPKAHPKMCHLRVRPKVPAKSWQEMCLIWENMWKDVEKMFKIQNGHQFWCDFGGLCVKRCMFYSFDWNVYGKRTTVLFPEVIHFSWTMAKLGGLDQNIETACFSKLVSE